MNERPDLGTPKWREDVWPIMLRWLPAQPTTQDWAQSVDLYLKAKAELDRQKAQRAEQPKQAAGGHER